MENNYAKKRLNLSTFISMSRLILVTVVDDKKVGDERGVYFVIAHWHSRISLLTLVRPLKTYGAYLLGIFKNLCGKIILLLLF